MKEKKKIKKIKRSVFIRLENFTDRKKEEKNRKERKQTNKHKQRIEIENK